MRDDRPAAGAVLRALLEPGDFRAGGGIVNVVGLGAAAEHHGPAVLHDDLRRGKSLPQIALQLRLALGVEVLVVDRAIGLPDGAAGFFVERDDELKIAPVEMHQQQIAVENRRGAGRAEMVADKIRALPKHLARRGVEARGAGRAEGDIDAAFLDHRRGRGVGVERVAELGLGDAEENGVAENRAGVLINADDGELLAIHGRGREPDLVFPNHGRGPGLAVNLGFPLHALGFVERHGEIFRVRVAVAGGPAELRPIFGGAGGRGEERGAEDCGDSDDGAERGGGGHGELGVIRSG